LRTGFDGSLEGLRHVQLRPPVVAPVGEARSDTDIVMGLAPGLGLSDRMFDLDADRGHDAVLAKTGLTVEMLRGSPAGIAVDGVAQVDAQSITQDGRPRGYPTPTGKIEIYSERLMLSGYRPIPELDVNDLLSADVNYPLRLGSAKSVAYCHSQHRNIGSLRRLVPDPIVEMSPADAAARSIVKGDWVRIRTRSGDVVARAALVPGLASGAVFGQHGWWVDGGEGTPYDRSHPLAANLNGAIGTDRADPVSGSIPLRSSWCQIEKMSSEAPSG
jgi:anaerobic selenocysteine-containing dehydrogenase